MYNDTPHLQRTNFKDFLPARKAICSTLIALLVIIVCILPMGLFPLWNGETPDHRNQYELMAEAILAGRIDFAYGDEDVLLALENPYDPTEREHAGIEYHWDHAYYNGHYYMYFGIVPVLLVFLPYRVLTGTALTTYHATQFFVAIAVAGVFVLFYQLRNLFFRDFPFGLYLTLSTAFSIMSVWYSVAEPALYCTAITSALALEIWSLSFFVRAVWGETCEKRQFLSVGIGSFLGALVFGCRPPIGLANLLVIPMLIVFIKQCKLSLIRLSKLAFAVLPYAVVAIALMGYNYARFDDPFEFGQSYQLTVADQSQYRLALDPATFLHLTNSTAKNLFAVGDISVVFPYLSASSVFYNFPILWLGIAGLIVPSVLSHLRQTALLSWIAGLLFTVILISCVDTLYTPYLLERYRMDIYYLMGIGCYIVVGLWYTVSSQKQRTRLCAMAGILSVITAVSSCLLCLNIIADYYPEKVRALADALHL